MQIGRFNLQIELRQHIETTACVSNLQIETFCTLGRLDLQTETANVSNLQIGFQSVDWVPICRLRRSAHWDQHINRNPNERRRYHCQISAVFLQLHYDYFQYYVESRLCSEPTTAVVVVVGAVAKQIGSRCLRAVRGWETSRQPSPRSGWGIATLSPPPRPPAVTADM